MMTRMDTALPASPLTPMQWVICAVAALGFAFDSGSYNTFVNSASGINPPVLRGHIFKSGP